MFRKNNIWHQKQERVRAHILVCFPAYVLWKMLAQTVKQADPGRATAAGALETVRAAGSGTRLVSFPETRIRK